MKKYGYYIGIITDILFVFTMALLEIEVVKSLELLALGVFWIWTAVAVLTEMNMDIARDYTSQQFPKGKRLLLSTADIIFGVYLILVAVPIAKNNVFISVVLSLAFIFVHQWVYRENAKSKQHMG